MDLPKIRPCRSAEQRQQRGLAPERGGKGEEEADGGSKHRGVGKQNEGSSGGGGVEEENPACGPADEQQGMLPEEMECRSDISGRGGEEAREGRQGRGTIARRQVAVSQ